MHCVAPALVAMWYVCSDHLQLELGSLMHIESVHCREEGGIGKYTLGRGVQNPRLREISRAEGGVFSNASRLEAVY